jgi:hypothetical protein
MRFKDGKSEIKEFSKNDKVEVIYGYIYSKMDTVSISENIIDIYTMGFPTTKLELSKTISEYFQSDQEVVSIKETHVDESIN